MGYQVIQCQICGEAMAYNPEAVCTDENREHLRAFAQGHGDGRCEKQEQTPEDSRMLAVLLSAYLTVGH